LLEWIQVHQINDQSAAKSLAVRITIDGQVLQSGSVSCAHNTGYRIYIHPTGILAFSTGDVNPGIYIPWPGRSVKVEVQFADVPGTNQVLNAWIQYATLKATTL